MTTCKIMINKHDSIDIPYLKYISDEFKNFIGDNTGNLLINKYGKKQLDYNFIDYDSSENPDEFLILAANNLRPNTDVNPDNISKLLSTENKNKPINIIGLGANAMLEKMNPKEYVKTLSDNTIKWINIIADRCNSIGVRGEFTADVLKELGIKNVDVVGCPTWFVNGYNQPIITKKEWSKDLKPVFHTAWDPYSNWHSAWHNTILNQMLELNDPKFVMQSEFKFLPYMIANKDMPQFIAGGLTAEDLKASAQSVIDHFAISEYEVWQNKKIRNMFEMFGNIDEWAKLIQTRDFSFGFRIHGSIISIKNGIPAICLCSDSRTYELCKLFRIPIVRVDEISSDKLNIHKIYDEANFDDLNKEYPKLLENFIKFLDKNNIKHKLKKQPE